MQNCMYALEQSRALTKQIFTKFIPVKWHYVQDIRTEFQRNLFRNKNVRVFCKVRERRGRRRRKLLHDYKERRGYSHLKEEAVNRNMWRARFGRVFGPVVRQTTKWMYSVNSFTPLCKVSWIQSIFVKLFVNWQLIVKNPYYEFHENTPDGLVADKESIVGQREGSMDGRSEKRTCSPHKALVSLQLQKTPWKLTIREGLQFKLCFSFGL